MLAESLFGTPAMPTAPSAEISTSSPSHGSVWSRARCSFSSAGSDFRLIGVNRAGGGSSAHYPIEESSPLRLILTFAGQVHSRRPAAAWRSLRLVPAHFPCQVETKSSLSSQSHVATPDRTSKNHSRSPANGHLLGEFGLKFGSRSSKIGICPVTDNSHHCHSLFK